MFDKTKLRKFMPLFVTAILAAVIILPMWAGNVATKNDAAEIKTLAELKAAFEAGGEYKLAADIETDAYIEGNKDITLDLNGHKISRTNIESVTSGDPERFCIRIFDGTFTINNSASTPGEIYAAEKDGVAAAPRAVGVCPAKDAKNAHPSVIVNKGVVLKVKGTGGTTGVHALGIYTNHMTSSEEVTNTATAVVNDGAILDASTCPENSSGKSITVEGYGTIVKINGGEFKGAKHFLGAYCGANVVIENGTFTSDKKGFGCENALITINNGSFKCNQNLTNALMCPTMSSDYSGSYQKGKIIVNNGEFWGNLSQSYDEYGRELGYIEIYNGTFHNNPHSCVVGSADVTESQYTWVVKNTLKEISDYNGLKLLEKGGTFKVASNIVIPDDSNRVTLKKDTTLDLNGKEITKTATVNDARVLFRVEDGDFKVTNNNDTVGKIVLTVDNDQLKGRVFQPGASTTSIHPKLTLDGKIEVSMKGGAEKSDCISAYTEYDNGTALDDPTKVDRTVDVTIGKNVVLASEKGRGILTEGCGVTVTINGATINSENHNVTSNNMGAVLTINDGVFTGARHCLYNCKATIKVNGGTFKTTNAEKFVLYNDEDADHYYEAKADTTMTITGGSFTGAIKNVTDETQGKATISISNGTFTVDPIDYLAEGAVVTQEGDLYIVSKSDTPVKPAIDPEVQKEIPATVDTTQVADTYTEPAAAVEGTSFKADDVETVNGAVVMKEDKATDIISKGLADNEKLKEVSPLPIFTIKVDTASGKIIACTTLKVDGADLLATEFSKVDVRKMLNDTTSAKFVYTSDPKAYADGTFTLLEEDGKTATGNIDVTKSYQLLLFVQDNGAFDADMAIGSVKDPSALVKVEEQAKPSSSSSGGCNAGFGALALLMALPMFYRRKK